ncbi:MAG: hypothetical protein VB934_07975 [Polyangiaceae bacterium]
MFASWRRGPGRLLLSALSVISAIALGMMACESGSTSETGTTKPSSPAAAGTGSGAASGTGRPTSGSSSAGGEQAGSGAAAPVIHYCTECDAPATQGKLANTAIDEASGMVASRVHPGVLYVHNDSGDQPRFFAIGHAGQDLGQFDVMDAKAVDWEDIALGPCDGGHCLFIGDFGDNGESRTDYVVYRLPEPSTVRPGAQNLTSDAIGFEYPDGSHNAETLLADPTTGQLFIVTKVSSGPSDVYRFPKDIGPATTAVLTHVGTVQPPQGIALITGGDAHASGVLLRTYTHMFFYGFASGDIAASLAAEPCSVPTGFEVQGETVAWAPDAQSYFTVSEGKSMPVYQTTCSAP